MKVVYVGGQCPFCEGFPDSAVHADHLTVGRHYTVVRQDKIIAPWAEGVGYLLGEVNITPGWYWCSCAFREVKGDKESWQRIMEQSKPKTKELEPA